MIKKRVFAAIATAAFACAVFAGCKGAIAGNGAKTNASLKDGCDYVYPGNGEEANDYFSMAPGTSAYIKGAGRLDYHGMEIGQDGIEVDMGLSAENGSISPIFQVNYSDNKEDWLIGSKLGRDVLKKGTLIEDNGGIVTANNGEKKSGVIFVPIDHGNMNVCLANRGESEPNKSLFYLELTLEGREHPSIKLLPDKSVKKEMNKG